MEGFCLMVSNGFPFKVQVPKVFLVFFPFVLLLLFFSGGFWKMFPIVFTYGFPFLYCKVLGRHF